MLETAAVEGLKSSLLVTRGGVRRRGRRLGVGLHIFLIETCVHLSFRVSEKKTILWLLLLNHRFRRRVNDCDEILARSRDSLVADRSLELH